MKGGQMREINFYDINREMPTNDSRQISIPMFMLTEKHVEVKPDHTGIYQFLHLFFLVIFSGFFMAIDIAPLMSWIGMIGSFILFTYFGIRGNGNVMD